MQWGYNKRQICQRQEMNFPTENTLKPTELMSNITDREYINNE